MAEHEQTTSKARLGPMALRVAASVAIGFVVFAIVQLAQSRSAGTAEVTMVLEESEVSWPYHDAVREAAVGQLLSNDEATQLAEELAGAGATVDAQLRTGQSIFSFSVQGDDTGRSAEAADALVEWLQNQNLTELRRPMQDELQLLTNNQDELQAEIDAFLSSGADAGGETLEAARYLENASLLAQYERQADEVQTEMDLLRPQYSAASPAKAPTGLLTPLITGIAAVVAALAAFVVFEPRSIEPQRNGPASQ